MAEAVYFWNLRASRKAPFEAKVKRMLKLAGLGAELRSGDLTAVKLHFGEGGGTAHIRPLQLTPLLAFIRKCGAKPFLTDTNTLYVGQRGESVSHCLQAAAHGF
ncbi:MAG TPA: FeS-binding protein, partial [Desulfomicrobium sp.]|nr:FeS-binding protein [Desulfomicrobium sp.]